MAPFRACFYRHASLLNGPLQGRNVLSLIVFGVCLVWLALTRARTQTIENNAFWQVILSRELPNSVRLAVGIAMLLGLTALWMLVRPGKVAYLPWDSNSRRLLLAFGASGLLPPPMGL